MPAMSARTQEFATNTANGKGSPLDSLGRWARGLVWGRERGTSEVPIAKGFGGESEARAKSPSQRGLGARARAKSPSQRGLERERGTSEVPSQKGLSAK